MLAFVMYIWCETIFKNLVSLLCEVIFYSDPSGFSGQSYDRNVFEANLSTVNKLQRDYWNAKQVLRKKLGKQEDKHVVASDSELDSKLEVSIGGQNLGFEGTCCRILYCFCFLVF